MMPEDREPNAPDMPHADTHTPLHGPTGGVPSAFRQGTLTLRHLREDKKSSQYLPSWDFRLLLASILWYGPIY